MTKEQALLWVLGVVGSVCAGAVTLDKVLDIIHKYIKRAQAPDAAHNASAKNRRFIRAAYLT